MAVQLHQLGAIMQYVVFGLSAALALFFLVQIRRRNVNWEILFATAALATLYMLERQWGPAGPADISMPRSGQRLPWFRYAEWLLTFPPLLAAVANLTGLGKRKWGQGMALLGAFQVALLGGVTAAYSTGLAAKIVFACIAAAAYAVVLVLTSVTFGLTYREVPLSLRGFVSLLRALLLLTWLVYPVVWAVGPAGFRQISFDGETVAFAFADIFAKCAWSLLLWYFRRTVRLSVPAQFWAAQGDAQAAPGALGESAIAQQLLAKGDPVFLPGRRFQPAVAEVGEGSPSGKVPLLLEEPEEVPLTGWPLGLARARVHVAPRDLTRPRASPRFWFPGLSDQIRTEQAAYSPTGTPFPVSRNPSLNPSPRQELESGEGVTVYRNPLALTESGEQEVGDAAEARARARELAIDIPGEGSGPRTPVWGGAETDTDRKRTWAAFVRSFGQKSPPEKKTEEGEAGYRTLARPAVAGLYFGAQRVPGEESPVSVLPEAAPEEATPGSEAQTPVTRLERISEGPEGCGVDTSPMTSASRGSPSLLTSPVSPPVPLVERQTPRATPRRRPLPFLDPETGELNRGMLTEAIEEEPVPDVTETSPVVSSSRRRTRRSQLTGEDDSDVDSFDSVGSGMEESDSGESGGGLDVEVAEPKFRVFLGRPSKPVAGSPPVNVTGSPVTGAAHTTSRRLTYEPSGPLNDPALVGQLFSASKESSTGAEAETFDEERRRGDGLILARPARRRFGETDPTSPRARRVLGREGSEDSAASSSPRGSRGDVASPPGRSGLSRSQSAEDLNRGGISVSFAPPQRRSGGSFAYWSGGKVADFRSSSSEKDLSDYWGSVTGTPASVRSPEAEAGPAPDVPDVPFVRVRDEGPESSAPAGPQSDFGSERRDVSFAERVVTFPARDVDFAGADVTLQRYGSSGVSFESDVRAAESDPGLLRRRPPEAELRAEVGRRSLGSADFTWRLANSESGDDLRRRSFPVPQSRDQRNATEDLREFFPAAPARLLGRDSEGLERVSDSPPSFSVELETRIAGPAPEAWEEGVAHEFSFRPEAERDLGGMIVPSGSDSGAFRSDESGVEALSGTGTQSGAIEQRISGLEEESGQSAGRRLRRPSPYYYYSGNPVTLPPVAALPGRLEPIVEVGTPEVMSPESGERPRTAIRFYSPQFRRQSL